MKTHGQEKIKYWSNHFEQSKLYPEGIQSYCKANKLATSAYYKWRQRILNSKPPKPGSKKVKPSFLPVLVKSPETQMQSYPQHHQSLRQLPDSRWVAEIITNVIRGLL